MAANDDKKPTPPSGSTPPGVPHRFPFRPHGPVPEKQPDPPPPATHNAGAVLGVSMEARAAGEINIPPHVSPETGPVFVQSNDDAASLIARQTGERHRGFIAAATAAQPGYVPMPPELSASTAIAEVRSSHQARVLEALVLNFDERPETVRNAVVDLISEIDYRVDELQSRLPNEAAGRHETQQVIDFLQSVSRALREIADTLDHAIDAKSRGLPDRIFLGKAAELVDQLQENFEKLYFTNIANVAETTARASFSLALFGVLYYFGCGEAVAALLAGTYGAVKYIKPKKDGQ